MTGSARTVSSGRSTAGPARQESLRSHNLGIVLAEIVHSATPPSRADIAQRTGLTRTTVSALSNNSCMAVWWSSSPPSDPRPAGPAAPLVAAPGSLTAVGMEINVDYLAVRIVDMSGVTLAERMVVGDYRESAPDEVIAALAGLYGQAATSVPIELPIVGICVALPGLVDTGAGPLRIAPNLGWTDVDVVSLLRLALGAETVPVILANEATLAAQAEAKELRSGRISSFFYVSGEIGIGGATIADRGVAEGVHGWSGEIGHTLVDPRGPRCRCGATGCLEQYAGKLALLASAGLGPEATVPDLVAAVVAADTTAVAALERAGDALGVALANTINLIDVDTLVLGGSFAPLVEYLRVPIERQLRLRVLWHAWSPVTIRAAVTGERAALIGAAQLLLDTVIADPAGWLVT